MRPAWARRADNSQAKNVVFNVSEMEAKVRDATNDEPWYAFSYRLYTVAHPAVQGCELDAHARDRSRVRVSVRFVAALTNSIFRPVRTFNL